MNKQKEVQPIPEVTVRFAGDSGDGMHLAATQFTTETALAGNDLSTLPDFPAEIRAPAGTLAGGSVFQLHFSSTDIQTRGDSPDVLVAMNPAALKVNMRDLKPHATIIANSSAFDAKNLKLANYDTNPLEDGSLAAYNVVPVDLTQLTMAALNDMSLSPREKEKCKNFFALGLLYWIYNRPLEHSLHWLVGKFGKKPDILEANKPGFIAGHNYREH